MNQTLRIELDVEFFQIEDAAKAESLANEIDGTVYTWKTIGKSNWLEHGYRIVDALGLVILPKAWPDTLQMCDDPDDE